jgi:hypothetical protein
MTALCVLLGASPLRAQGAAQPGETPANLSYVEGTVDFVHEGVSERAVAPTLLLEGDLVRTGNGRAEIIFGDGTLLHLDHSGELEVLAPTRQRLSQGRISVRVSPAAADAYVIDTPGGSVSLDARGEFGIVADRAGRLEVSTSRGTAEIDDGSQRVIVRAGEMVTLAQPGARPDYHAFNSARWDSFARWAYERGHGSTASPSASRLPSELRVYSDVLDDNGHWEYNAPYGYVWYPTAFVGWRPYYHGRWAHTRYGWTWYGRDRWAWPTHHYGRWGFNGVAWFWIPLQGWGPAWVSWGHAPGFVSWAPLGWDGGPAISLWPRRDHPAYWPHDPWRGWTVVPNHRFGGPGAVRAAAIDGRLIDDTTRRAMIIEHSGPSVPGAVPRGSVAGAGAGVSARRGVTRDNVPGSVRRPTAAPGATGVAGPTPVPSRRVDDAPVYAPTSSPEDRSGSRVRTRASDERDGTPSTDEGSGRRGGVRYANPGARPRAGDTERPVVTGPGDRTDGARERGAPSSAGSGSSGESGSRPGAVRAAPRGDSPRSGGSPGRSDGSGARSRGGAGSGSGGTGSSGSGSAGSGAGRGGGGGAGRSGGAVSRGVARPR